jgi:serine/threonine-protein kinase
MNAGLKLKNRYEVRDKLGSGGMGAVYRAYDRALKTEVALKVLLDISDKSALKMFREESEKLARLVHPNIVEVRDAGEFEDARGKHPFLVMPLLRGRTLDELIAKQRLTQGRVVEILVQTCRGLQAAHDAGLVHRDIKPSNIFVLEDDSTKIIDFGVARWGETAHTIGRKGTLLYMSPEQVSMKGVSPQSDIFSLGVVAYEAFAGKRPFDGRTEDEVADAIQMSTPPPLSEFNPTLSTGLAQTVHKALAKQPFHRFKSAREFGDTLQKAYHNQPIDFFNPSKLQPRIQRAQKALDDNDPELAAEILAELEDEGHLDESMTALHRRLNAAQKQKRVTLLLDSARTRVEQQEYPLALQKIQEALKLDPNNTDALTLKESIEARRKEQAIEDWLQLARQHIDNFAHDRAREALNNALQVAPNHPKATALLNELKRHEQDYERVLTEKDKLHRAAVEALDNGEISSALSKMEKVLSLDRRAPDRQPNRSTAYQSLYNQLRSAQGELNIAYAEARRLQSEGQHDRALKICGEQLAKYPGNALFQALKLDIEVSERQQISAYIAETDRRVEEEPDLDRRVAILKEAAERYPNVEHFATNYRLAKDKRELIESIVAKAHVLEERGQFGESVGQWQILRSIYDRYPGLDFEIDRVTRRRDQLAFSEARSHAIAEIERVLDAGDYRRALELGTAAKTDFPNDSEFDQLETAAQMGLGHLAEAQAFVSQARTSAASGDYGGAAEFLRRAYRLDSRNPEIGDALQNGLLDYAKNLVDRDWRAAETVLNEAISMGVSSPLARSLQRTVADRRREEEVRTVCASVRECISNHELKEAARRLKDALARYPQEVELQQLQSRLKKATDERRRVDLEEAERLYAGAEQQGTLQSARDALEQTSVLVTRHDGDEAFKKYERGLRARLETGTEMSQGAPASGADRKEIAAGVASPTEIAEGPPESAEPGSRRYDGAAPSPIAGRDRLRTRQIWIAGIAAAVVLTIFGVAWFLGALKKRPAEPKPATVAEVAIPMRILPAGANLIVDGKPATSSGSSIAVQPGEHRYQVSAPGYKPATGILDSGQKQFAVSLDPLPPTLRVETDLAAGKVGLDGTEHGDLEGGMYTFDPAPEGEHSVTVGYGRVLVVLPVQANRSVLTINGQVAARNATVLVISTSNGKAAATCSRRGLMLRIDDQKPFDCPVTPSDVPAAQGPHVIEVIGNGQSLTRKNVEVGPVAGLSAFVMTDFETGVLEVDANQDDYSVFVNGKSRKERVRRGIWKANLPPGDVTVTVQKQGYRSEPADQTVRIKRGTDTPVKFALTPLPTGGSLRVGINAAADQIRLSGPGGVISRTGNSADFTGIPAGDYELAITKSGYADYKTSVRIEEGKLATKEVEMSRLEARLEVIVRPANANAQISVDGKHALRSAQTAAFPEGSHRVTISASGFVNQERDVMLEPGKTEQINILLTRVAQPPKEPPVQERPVLPGFTDESDGWMARSGPASVPFQTPGVAQVSFEARWDKHKTLGLGGGGAVHWVLGTVDGTDRISFKIDNKRFEWEHFLRGARVGGKTSNVQAGEVYAVRIEMRPNAIVVYVNGLRMPEIATDLRPAVLQFEIHGGEVLHLRNLHYR